VNQTPPSVASGAAIGMSDANSDHPSDEDASRLVGHLAERLDKLERRHAETALITAREDLERRELQMLMTRAAEDAVSRALQPQIALASSLLGDRFERWQQGAGDSISRAVLDHLVPITQMALRVHERMTDLEPAVAEAGEKGNDLAQATTVDTGEMDVLRERNQLLASEADRLAEALGEAKLHLERARAERATAEHQFRELRADSDLLRKKLVALAKGVELLRGTARWRIGDTVVRSIELAMFKRRRATVLDEMSSTLSKGK